MRPRLRLARTLACAAGPLLLVLAAPAAPVAAGPPMTAAASPAPGWRWQRTPIPVAEEGARAVAVAADGRWALGDDRGLVLGGGGGAGRPRRLPLRGAVADLAFAPDGSLWIASAEGLLWRAPHPAEAGRLQARPPAPGDAAADVRRLAVGRSVVAVATAAGVFWSRDGRRFARVDGSFGSEPAAGLALLEPAAAGPPVLSAKGSPVLSAKGPPVLWIAAERGIFRAVLSARDGASRTRAERIDALDLRPALDVSIGPAGLLALGPDRIAVSAAEAAASAAARGWRVHRPRLPPGASPVRVLAAAGKLWLASDRGLLEADGPAGPWRRAGDPAGTLPVQALAAGAGRVLVASARGLLVGSPAPPAAPPAAAPPAPREATPGCDPPIARVHAAVLSHLDLRGDRIAHMWSGVRRRGWLPEVTLEGAYGAGVSDGRKWDQSFSSGATHHLYDRDRQHDRDQELSLRLQWDLGDVLYHAEEIDVSTEARRTIELRDDVLDEVNQLYFDRRRALAAAAAAEPGSPEAVRERLRAEELAAGLDGWTGGWFGARAGRAPCDPAYAR